MDDDVIRFPTSKFVRVTCAKCKNNQIIFNKASTPVKCLKCGEIIAIPAGGIAEISGNRLDMRG